MGGGTAGRSLLDARSEIYSVVLSLAADGLHYQVLNIHNASRTDAQIADDLALIVDQIRSGVASAIRGQLAADTRHSIR
jgi:hypothetical protein